MNASSTAVRFGVGAAAGLVIALAVGFVAHPARGALEAAPTLAPPSGGFETGAPSGGLPSAGPSGPGGGSAPPPAASSGGGGAASPSAVAPQPSNATLQLLTYVSSGASPSPGASGVPLPLGEPANTTVPRIPAITQFDGGPLGNANCTLASGAMLARLAFGIVTTGTQLRALQDDQEGGTSLSDLQSALRRGWNVQFSQGVLTPLQLRALLFGGAGVEIGGLYSLIPVELRLQKNFTGGHAIYLDGFRGPGPEGPAAYFVIDPIGRPWQGYRGSWWPAEIVESFGIALGVRTGSGGPGIGALWAFPGGAAPTTHPILPPEAYPGAAPGPGPSPGQSGGPSPSAVEDPMPLGDVGELPPADQGDLPPDSPPLPTIQAIQDASSLSSLLARCAVAPAPTGCPPGLVGTIVVGSPGATGAGPPTTMPVLFVTAIGPGMYRVIFEPPPETASEVWVWVDGDEAPALKPADAALLDGRPVGVATFTVDPAATFRFAARATGNGIDATTPVIRVVPAVQ